MIRYVADILYELKTLNSGSLIHMWLERWTWANETNDVYLDVNAKYVQSEKDNSDTWPRGVRKSHRQQGISRNIEQLCTLLKLCAALGFIFGIDENGIQETNKPSPFAAESPFVPRYIFHAYLASVAQTSIRLFSAWADYDHIYRRPPSSLSM